MRAPRIGEQPSRATANTIQAEGKRGFSASRLISIGNLPFHDIGSSKKTSQRLPHLGIASIVCCQSATWFKAAANGCGDVSGRWVLMTNLARAVIGCISAMVMLPGVASIAGADTFTYNLNNSLKAQDGDPQLVSYGGTVGHTGYTFGVQQGLSLSGTGILDVYSIEIRFYFDDLNASPNGFQRMLEFKNLASDTGLYERGGALLFFVRGNQTGASSGTVFASGEPADLLLTRSAAGLLSAYVNDTLAFTFSDPTGLATFSGPDNVVWFFMDDFESLATGFPEAGSGFVDRIRITTPRDITTVPGPIVGAGLPGLILAGAGGLLGWWRRRGGKCA
jgi:hypothetical protein